MALENVGSNALKTKSTIMTITEYKIRAAEFRAHMEQPFGLSDGHCVLATKESPWLPGGYERSVKVRLEASSEDLSHLNGTGWKTSKENGSRGGNRTVRRRKEER